MSSITEISTGEWNELPEGFSPDVSLYVFTDIHGYVPGVPVNRSARRFPMPIAV